MNVLENKPTQKLQLLEYTGLGVIEQSGQLVEQHLQRFAGASFSLHIWVQVSVHCMKPATKFTPNVLPNKRERCK